MNLVPYDVYDAWVTLDKADSGMTAVPATAPQGSGLDLKAFQNLGYTGEWFVFAGFVIFMWFRLLRREAEFERDAALGLTESDATGTAPDAAGASTRRTPRSPRAPRRPEASPHRREEPSRLISAAADHRPGGRGGAQHLPASPRTGVNGSRP